MVAAKPSNSTARQELLEELAKEKAKVASKPGTKKPTTRSKPTPAADANKENSHPEGGDSAQSTDIGEIRWAQEANFPLTDKLLTIIEESPRFRQMFGFEVGEAKNVNSGGLSRIAVCRIIAPKLFPTHVPGSDRFPNSIKNRIENVKGSYHTYRKQLGNTGHGLLVEGRGDEIIKGTPAYNAHDNIKKKFPWYLRLHRLLSVSPIYDPSALANSTTALDLAILQPASHQPSNRADADEDLAASNNDDHILDPELLPPTDPIAELAHDDSFRSEV